MSEAFAYDVFLSYSAQDKVVVAELAERLRVDGLRVWFDKWQLRPGDNIPAKIEEGLEQSRVLVLCMSANAFGSDWARLESYTFRFRDPLNQERRFIPLRLDDAAVPGSLAPRLAIDWRPDSAAREQTYARLLEVCRPSVADAHKKVMRKRFDVEATQLNSEAKHINAYAFNSDGKRVLTGGSDKTVRLWERETGRCLGIFSGHTAPVWSVAWSSDERRVLSGCGSNTVRLWDVKTGLCLREFVGHSNGVNCVKWAVDQRYALSGSTDNTVRLWDVQTGHCLRTFEGHTGFVASVAWSTDQCYALSGANDNSVRLWDIGTGRCLRVFEGHKRCVRSVTWSADQRHVLTSSDDSTIRLWDMETGRCLRILEGHSGPVWCVAWNVDGHSALSGSYDKTVRLWDMETGRCLRVFEGHTSFVRNVTWSFDDNNAFSGDDNGGIRVWNPLDFLSNTQTSNVTLSTLSAALGQVQYTNAKVLLVGESGVGKTGLSMRLAEEKWEPSDSTVGAWATQWKLPVVSGEGGDEPVEREIWLWDFGGQADQRLIHQLYMDETSLAVLVFDGQKEDLFETLGQWDRDLTRAARREFAKLLVAGRVDTGGLRVSRREVEKFARERQFLRFLETSAKTSAGCQELRQAILAGIDWNGLPCRTTKVLFKRLKEEIIRLKDEGRVLMRFNELRETLQLRLSGEFERFADAELSAVLTLLAGPGVVWELNFGSWVLLQPERINAYAQAVIRTLQEDERQRGCLMEERVLKGDLVYESSMPRLAGDEERFVLLAMHQTLVERGLCLRQPTEEGNLLVFPSYYRRERPELVGHPAVLVSYRFTGFLDEIYATLVVRLHHTRAFQPDSLWRYAADFKTETGKQLGVKLDRLGPGAGELAVYFDPGISMEAKIIFSRYIHEHLVQQARDVERLRHYVCPHCGTPVGNREIAMQRLNAWLQDRPPEPDATGWLKLRKAKKETPTIICVGCEKRVPLWDEMEECFADPEILQRVRAMQAESAIVLDNESKERALVGEVISTVALAGQICREFSVSDHGIDMEIEFKDDAHEATNRKLYLQLKSGDSYLRQRKSDGAEVFTVKNQRHIRYWMDCPFPVLLVIRNAEGEVRWMEVRDWLRRESDNGRRPVKQVVFDGERLDVMSVRCWRDRMLAG
jgi:small GTP-binding protein